MARVKFLQSHTCFNAMTIPAKGLPVAFIPKQDRIAAMWSDVVYHGCRSKFSFLTTLDAQRILP